jgi:hypothetical protein
VHGAAVPHVPFTHDSTAALPEHSVSPAEHEPMHDPIMQVEAEQGTAVPNAPLVVQVCTPLFMHCVLPGAHAPVHIPWTHA